MQHLFVYGTLKPDCTSTMGRFERARLASEADLIGGGTMPGTLLALGDYPGAIDGPGLVHGIVYALHAPAATLAWLDAYEGLGTSAPEYERTQRLVTLTDGSLLSCWTYLFMQSKGYSATIASGHW